MKFNVVTVTIQGQKTDREETERHTLGALNLRIMLICSKSALKKERMWPEITEQSIVKR